MSEEQGWNGWTYNDCTMTLTSPTPARYDVELEEFCTNAAAMDWLFQVTSKAWADDACIAGLMRAVQDIINPQANLCSFGVDKGMTAEQMLGLRERAKEFLGGD